MDLLSIKDPLQTLEEWMARAKEDGLATWNAVTLATVGLDGSPNARIVLFKGRSGRECHFFTNYESEKGRELTHTPRACLVYHDGEREVQARIAGAVHRLSREESEAYFATRPRESQIGAWASHQSQPLSSRNELETRKQEFEDKFRDQQVPCPPHWGGFGLLTETIELWVGRVGRLHDRARYVWSGERFVGTLLNP